MVSVTKLGIYSNDEQLNIQTFPTQSIFMQDHGNKSILIKHSTVNLSELPLYTDFNPMIYLTNQLAKQSIIDLLLQDLEKLFANIFKNDLNDLLN